MTTSLDGTLVVPDWPVASSVRALVTTRAGGSSTGRYASLNLGIAVGDDPQTVDRNRALLTLALPSAPRWLHQVHGTTVVDAAAVGAPVAADASVARDPGVVCAVQVADCLPILLAHPDGKVVGAAHAGWRGLAGGVIEATIARLGVAPQELVAWLGPAIGPQAFEVGADVLRAFTDHDPGAVEAFRPHDARDGKWFADIFVLARRRLHGAGVQAIHGGGLCTVGDPARFFSHRRDGVTGRMAALIWIERERI